MLTFSCIPVVNFSLPTAGELFEEVSYIEESEEETKEQVKKYREEKKLTSSSSHPKRPRYDHSSGNSRGGYFSRPPPRGGPHRVVLPGMMVLPIINFHIRVEVSQHTGAVDLVATETVTDTEIIHHRRVEVLVITIHQCVRVEVTGRHLLGAWNLHQLTTMTDMHPRHHHTAMTGSHHPHLMDMHLLPKEGEEVADIMTMGMVVMEVGVVTEVEVVTEVGVLLHLHHIIIPRGGTEQLRDSFFANFVVNFTFTLHMC